MLSSVVLRCKVLVRTVGVVCVIKEDVMGVGALNKSDGELCMRVNLGLGC
jgi:hypothetical protein